MEYTNWKAIILSVLLTSFIYTDCTAQSTDSTGILVKEINRECVSINNSISRFKVIQKDIESQSEEGGELKKFYDGKILRKAILSFFGETGKSTTEYYFLNGELIFVDEIEIEYQSPIYMGKTETKSQTEDKFYFKNQALIRWIGNGGKIITSERYPEKQKEILDDLRNIINKDK